MLEDFTRKVEKPFHSSGYAEIANGTSIGSSSVQPFRERYHIEQNRRHVGRYGQSHLANVPFQQERRPLPGDGNSSRITARRGDLASKPIVIPPRVGGQGPRFSEPHGRPYNPFG